MRQYRRMAQEASRPLPVCLQQMGLEHSLLPSLIPTHAIKDVDVRFKELQFKDLFTAGTMGASWVHGEFVDRSCPKELLQNRMPTQATLA